QVLALAGDDGPPSHAKHAERLAADRVVARPEEAAGNGGEDERRRDQPERRELMAGAEPEGERQQGDDDEGGHNPPEPRPLLATRIETRLPEDEHGDQRDERKPFALGVPE